MGWDTAGKKAKRIRYRGEPRKNVYRFTTDGISEPLRETGSSTTQITIQSLDDAFLLSTFRQFNTGSLDARTFMGILQNITRFLDFNSQVPSVESEEKLLELYTNRIRWDLPVLSSYLEKFANFKSIGHPGSDTAPSHVEITYDVNGKALRKHYPDFYEVYEGSVMPAEISVDVSDSTGRLLLDFDRMGKRATWEYFSRKGTVVPFQNDTASDTLGYTPMELRQMELKSDIEAGISMFGLYFGMENIIFKSNYEEGKVTWRLAETPVMDLPLGFRILLSPFISPFLSYLNTGNEGKGLSYREYFRMREKTMYHIDQLWLPLRDSPFMTFLIKLSNLATQSLDREAIADIMKFGGDVSERLGKDYYSYIEQKRKPGELVKK